MWTKLVTKVNGLGGRVKKVEENCSTTASEVKSLTANVAEYRRDVQEVTGKIGRIDKGLEDLHEEIQQGNIALGSQLSEVSRALTKMDKDITGRLIAVEVLAKIEQKLGKPIPTD